MSSGRTSKTPNEERPFGFDFAGDLDVANNETIASAVFSIVVVDGVDPSPGAMLSGAVAVSGSQATRKVIGGLAGVTYKLSAVATTSAGNKLEGSCLLSVA